MSSAIQRFIEETREKCHSQKEQVESLKRDIYTLLESFPDRNEYYVRLVFDPRCKDMVMFSKTREELVWDSNPIISNPEEAFDTFLFRLVSEEKVDAFLTHLQDVVFPTHVNQDAFQLRHSASFYY